MPDRELRDKLEQVQAEVRQLRLQLEQRTEEAREPFRAELERLEAQLELKDEALAKLTKSAEADRARRLEAEEDLKFADGELKESQALVQRILKRYAATADQRQQIIDELLAEQFEATKKPKPKTGE